jgi:hypothetical protein
MARFARDALNKMNDLERLEVSLGPDTGDLSTLDFTVAL